jgi:hypothetical protein
LSTQIVVAQVSDCQFDESMDLVGHINGSSYDQLQGFRNEIGYLHTVSISVRYEDSCYHLYLEKGGEHIDPVSSVISNEICDADKLVQVVSQSTRYSGNYTVAKQCLVVRDCIFLALIAYSTDGGAINLVSSSAAWATISDCSFLACQTTHPKTHGGAVAVCVDMLLVERICGMQCVSEIGTFGYSGRRSSMSEFFEGSILRCGTKEGNLGNGGAVIAIQAGPFQLRNANMSSCHQNSRAACLEQIQGDATTVPVFSGYLMFRNCSGTCGLCLSYDIGMRLDSCVFLDCAIDGSPTLAWLTQSTGNTCQVCEQECYIM